MIFFKERTNPFLFLSHRLNQRQRLQPPLDSVLKILMGQFWKYLCHPPYFASIRTYQAITSDNIFPIKYHGSHAMLSLEVKTNVWLNILFKLFVSAVILACHPNLQVQ